MQLKNKVSGAKRTLAIGSTIIAVASVASGLALQQFTQTGANEVPEIYTQVADHEGRIDTLETKQGETEQKVEQNTQTIQTVQQGVSASGSTTTTQTAQTTSTAPSPSQPASEPAPEPAPAPKPHPRTITAVAESPTNNGLHTCDYTLYDPIEDIRQGNVIQPVEIPCQAVGTVLQ